MATQDLRSRASLMIDKIIRDAWTRDRLIQRIQSRHTIEENGCWLWTGSDDGNGYGRIKFMSTMLAAHRASYAIHHLVNPKELLVCHHCDTPQCINPEHLFLGTDADNCADKMRKGRHKAAPCHRGEANPSAKLTVTQVDAIKALIRNGWTNTAIAERYGVHHATISTIRRGKNWGGEPIGKPYASLTHAAGVKRGASA